MKTEKKIETGADELACFECEAGRLRAICEDYRTKLPSGLEVTVANVPMLRCESCGDKVICDEGNRKIDSWLNRITNAITPDEVQTFLTKYGLTQREASRITGLGEKNISRWLTGHSRPSESVSNFLRLLIADQSALDRLKQKRFDDSEPAMLYPREERQPDAEEKKVLQQIDFAKLAELGVVNPTQSPLQRRSEICRWAKCGDLLEFRQSMKERMEAMAAFRDTKQKASAVSGGLWTWLGELAADRVETGTYDREKLSVVVKQLRGLTTQPLPKAVKSVQAKLAKVGVALVFIPIMKESAFRGCTRMLTRDKAIIIHALKYRNLSQFWIILFHEIAHLMLHIDEPGQAFPDYDDSSSDPKELQADEWAFEKLAPRDKELEWIANRPSPTAWDLRSYAEALSIHPAIAAEILNRREKREIFPYAYLRKENLFPHLSEDEAKALMGTSRF